MKKKKTEHPKLYIDAYFNDSNLILKYLGNKFRTDGRRVVEEEILNSIKTNDKKEFLRIINREQYSFLKKYINIQKKVLVKHQKSRNYDSAKVVDFSIKSMNEFKKKFELWFDGN